MSEEYFPHLVDLARCLIDGELPEELQQDRQLRQELGVDLKELLTVVGILYEKELGRQALEKFRDDTRPEA